jgi:hypothetical protein
MTMARQSSLLFLFFGIYAIPLVIIFYVTRDWNITQTIAIALTGLVIIWYTWETTQLGVETRRQTEVQLRPFVIVKPTKDGFQVSNIGNGPAINISIGDVVVDATEDVAIHFPESIPVLSNGISVPIRADSFKKGKPAGDFFIAHLNPYYANRTLPLNIEFQNVELRSYFVEERVVPGKLEIVGFR